MGSVPQQPCSLTLCLARSLADRARKIPSLGVPCQSALGHTVGPTGGTNRLSEQSK